LPFGGRPAHVPQRDRPRRAHPGRPRQREALLPAGIGARPRAPAEELHDACRGRGPNLGYVPPHTGGDVGQWRAPDLAAPARGAGDLREHPRNRPEWGVGPPFVTPRGFALRGPAVLFLAGWWGIDLRRRRKRRTQPAES